MSTNFTGSTFMDCLDEYLELKHDLDHGDHEWTSLPTLETKRKRMQYLRDYIDNAMSEL